MPKPRKKTPITSWLSLVLATFSDWPIAGRAGSMLSMAMATLAVMTAMVMMNSTMPMLRRSAPETPSTCSD
ncbi:hypothetical protein D3C71_2182590 [compost metagenome]